MSGGPFCFQAVGSTSKVYDLEARSGVDSNGCTVSDMAVNRQVPVLDSEGEGQEACTHCPSVANPAMACSPPLNAVQKTTPPTEAAISFDKSQQQDTFVDSSVESKAAWLILGVPSVTKEFQAEQRPSSCFHGGNLLKEYIPVA